MVGLSHLNENITTAMGWIAQNWFCKPDAIVMHPGPMNRGVEIDGEIADDINRSVIQEQVEMGVAVRMAAMPAGA